MTPVAVLISFFLSFLSMAWVEEIAVFCPPKGWEAIDCPSSKVLASFRTKIQKKFSPSLNYTVERISSSSKEYFASLEKLYTAHSDSRFRKLGTIPTQSGPAYLTSLDITTAAGKARILQSFFFQDTTVFILTAVAPLEDFGTWRQVFLDTFSSLQLVHSLEEYIKNPSQRPLFLDKFSQGDIPALQRLLTKEFSEEGPYWHRLVLEECTKKVQQNSTPK